MPTELAWSNQARTYLLDIYVLIGIERPAAAEALFLPDRSQGQVAAIAAMHGRMPHRRSAVNANAGRGTLPDFIRTVPDTDEGPVGTVEIIRVIDGRRDLVGLF